MGIASAASGALGIGMGLAQTLQGARQEKEASRALANYERQQLTNVADNLEVSTLGADIQRQEQSRLASSQIDAARGGGTRSLLASLGRIEAGNQNVNRQIAADIDMQQKMIQQQQAEDEARIRQMRENRENADVAALSSQVQAGRQDMWGGIGNMVKGVGMAGQAIGAMQGTGVQKPPAESIDNQLTPQGIAPMPTQRLMPSLPYSGNTMMRQPNPYVTQ